jgi:hypothetical protein
MNSIMSARLQNNVRVRILFILSLYALISLLLPYTPQHIQKVIKLIPYHYNFAVFLATLLPLKAAFFGALVIQSVFLVTNALAVMLGTIASVRCLTAQQAACIQQLPGTLLQLTLMGIIWILNGLQVWDLYAITRSPIFKTSSTQRIRILFAWIVPVAWVVNVMLHMDGLWTIWATPHLGLDPLVLVMASQRALVMPVCMGLIATDILTRCLVGNAYDYFICTQIGVAGYALVIHLIATTPAKRLPVVETAKATVAMEKSTPRKLKF